MTIALAAYQPDIAPNLGAMIRLASCFAADLHVIGPCGFPMSDKALRRAAMDYAGSVETRHHNSWNAFLDVPPSGRLVLMTTRGATPLWDFSFEPTDIVVMGRESAGVPDEVHDRADARILIPMPGGGRSLNVATAAGIALAEASRQLRPGHV